MTLGSLFDGAGTFPFAAQICGIETLCSSEIEPFPLAVTAKRFPHVKQLGDVTKINGAEIEPVDIITFGSPCQDLSVAGQRKGLDGERSGLFMEAVRIIKEMRARTDGIYPRYAVWENVPGAFSSNRLQGMPDWWCDDVPHSDSAEYKMWGNGIALPCALYVMEGLKGVGQNG